MKLNNELEKIYLEYPNEIYNYNFLSCNPNLSEKMLDINIKLWNITNIISNTNISFQYIRQKYDIGMFLPDLFLNKDNNNFKFVLDFWENLSSNPSITLKYIIENPKFPWSPKGISRNPNITLDVIENNSNFPWDWNEISSNISCFPTTTESNPDAKRNK